MTRSIATFPRRKRAAQNAARMTLAQLADVAGETVHAVRYYARLGLVAPAQVGANGYRHFDATAVSRLRFIRRAQRLGFTLEEIGSFVEDARRGRAPCPRVRALLDARMPTIAVQVADAQRLLERMQAAQRRWKRRPDAVPDGHAVCRLIEDVPDR